MFSILCDLCYSGDGACRFFRCSVSILFIALFLNHHKSQARGVAKETIGNAFFKKRAADSQRVLFSVLQSEFSSQLEELKNSQQSLKSDYEKAIEAQAVQFNEQIKALKGTSAAQLLLFPDLSTQIS